MAVRTFVNLDFGTLPDFEDVIVRKVGPSMGVLRLHASMPHSTLQLQLVSDLPDVLRAIVAMRLQH